MRAASSRLTRAGPLIKTEMLARCERRPQECKLVQLFFNIKTNKFEEIFKNNLVIILVKVNP